MNLDQLFEQAGQQYGIDPALLKAQAFAESSLNPNAVGPETKYGRAEGIAQFIPDTARRLGVTDPKDPKQAIPAQARLMAENLKRYKTPENALMAYHGGTDKTNWGPKTKAYTEKVMASYQPEEDFDPFSYASESTSATKAQQQTPVVASVPRPDDEDFDPFSYATEEDTAQKLQKEQAARGLPSSEKPKANVWTDVAKTIPSSVIKGFGAVPQIPAMTINTVGGALGEIGTFLYDKLADEKLTPEQKQKIMQGAQPLFTGNTVYDALTQAGKAVIGEDPGPVNPISGRILYQPQTPAGRITNALVSSATAGPSLGAGLTSSLLGGAGAGTAQELYPESNLAALAGGFAGGKIGRTIEGTPTSVEKAQLARDLEQNYGIKIPSYQLSGSPTVQRLGSMLERFGMTKDNDVGTAYSKAAAKTMGADPDSVVTPETMGKTRTQASKRYEKVINDIDQIKADDIIQGNKLQDIVDRVSNEGLFNNDSSKTNLTKLGNQIMNAVEQTANGDVISAANFKRLTKHDSNLTKLLKNPDTRQYAMEFKNLLQETLHKSASPEQLKQLQKLDYQWKNMKALENVAKSASAEGEFAPGRLNTAVSKFYDDAAYGGGGDLATLAKGAKNFKMTPSSGTAENVGLMHFMGNVLTPMGVGTALQFGGLPSTTALAGAAGTYLAGKGLGRALTSDTYRNMLINQALSPNSPNIMNLLAPAAITANQ